MCHYLNSSVKYDNKLLALPTLNHLELKIKFRK